MKDQVNQFKWLLVGSLAIILFVSTIGLSLAGNAYITAQYIHKQSIVAAQLHVREEESAIRTAVPTCRALLLMDDASHPPVTNASDSPNSYGHKLARAIHTVYIATDCSIILQKKPISVIEKELQQKQQQP